jgi:uncharacterized membrane protein YkoI
MPWELFEVWVVDQDGHEELFDTTKSFKEAQTMAQKALTEDIVECIIYKEEDGELFEVEVITGP